MRLLLWWWWNNLSGLMIARRHAMSQPCHVSQEVKWNGEFFLQLPAVFVVKLGLLLWWWCDEDDNDERWNFNARHHFVSSVDTNLKSVNSKLLPLLSSWISVENLFIPLPFTHNFHQVTRKNKHQVGSGSL